MNELILDGNARRELPAHDRPQPLTKEKPVMQAQPSTRTNWHDAGMWALVIVLGALSIALSLVWMANR